MFELKENAKKKRNDRRQRVKRKTNQMMDFFIGVVRELWEIHRISKNII